MSNDTVVPLRPESRPPAGYKIPYPRPEEPGPRVPLRVLVGVSVQGANADGSMAQIPWKVLQYWDAVRAEWLAVPVVIQRGFSDPPPMSDGV